MDDNPIVDPFADMTASTRKEAGVATSTKTKAGSFQSFGLIPPLLKAIAKKGYAAPTPIQKKCIPVAMQGRDVVAMARTGSGKTAAFLIPIINALQSHKSTVGARAVVLSPTRELASQTQSFFTALAKYTDLRSCLLVGGDSMESQFEKLAMNPDVLIATPGRIRHLLSEIDTFGLKMIQFVVFDEGDRLFEMGFAEDIKFIMDVIPSSRQTMIFSATLPALLVSFTRAGLNNPEVIRVGAEQQISDKLDIQFFSVRGKDKDAALFYLLKDFIPAGKQVIVFVATRHHVEYLHSLFSTMFQTPQSVAIYGKMDQAARKISLAKFSKKKADVMFVTDLAARGIDIPVLDVVINYDFPPKPKLFVHRVGRVARAGRSGEAFSLVDSHEAPYMFDLLLFLNKKLAPAGVANVEPGELRYGSFPQVLVDPITEQISATLSLNPELLPLQRSLANAHQLYAKTRAPASQESAARAKAIPKDAVHPLLVTRVDKGEVEKADFLSQIKNFRPPQTVFELAAKRSEKGTTAQTAMESKRRLHEDAIRDRRSNPPTPRESNPTQAPTTPRDENMDSDDELSEPTTPYDNTPKGKFRDEKFFMGHQKGNFHLEKGLEIAEKRDNMNIEEMVFDLIPEDARDIFRKRTAQQWDRKKKKYVQQSGGMDPTGLLRGTLRSESGTSIRKSKVKEGKTYDEWQKRTKKSIAKVGEQEDDHAHAVYQNDKANSRFRYKAGVKKEDKNVKDELKTKDQIKKNRKEAEKRELKQGGVKRKREEGERKKGEMRPSKRFKGAANRSKAIMKRR